MISIRGGAGLGDAIYVHAVARHLLATDEVEACTNYPDLFRALGDCFASPFRRHPIDRVAHYAARRGEHGTTQFEDVLISAGLPLTVPLRLDWNMTAPPIVAGTAARPLVLVALPRAPMGRTDGFGAEVLPDCRAIQKIIDHIAGACLPVQIGSGKPLFTFRNLSADLANKTTVCQMIDLASTAAGIIGYPSFVIPLAEALVKPAIVVWSRRGLNSQRPVIRQMTPTKLLHRGSLVRWLVDDAGEAQLRVEANAFLDAIRS